MLPRISDELVTLVRVLREDHGLRAKFTELAKLPPDKRSAALSQLVGCMKTGGEDTQLIRAIAVLRDDVIFAAVAKTVGELEQ